MLGQQRASPPDSHGREILGLRCSGSPGVEPRPFAEAGLRSILAGAGSRKTRTSSCFSHFNCAGIGFRSKPSSCFSGASAWADIGPVHRQDDDVGGSGGCGNPKAERWSRNLLFGSGSGSPRPDPPRSRTSRSNPLPWNRARLSCNRLVERTESRKKHCSHHEEVPIRGFRAEMTSIIHR
jgi:hypothetical protein